MKKRTKPKDETRERVHLMISKQLMAQMRKKAKEQNRMLSRQIEIALERELIA